MRRDCGFPGQHQVLDGAERESGIDDVLHEEDMSFPSMAALEVPLDSQLSGRDGSIAIARDAHEIHFDQDGRIDVADEICNEHETPFQDPNDRQGLTLIVVRDLRSHFGDAALNFNLRNEHGLPRILHRRNSVPNLECLV